MKNIYEDETLPSGAEIPKVKKPDVKVGGPVRPKRQMPLTPMQQERKVQEEMAAALPPQVMPMPQGQPMYQYIPVNPQYPQQGQQPIAYYPVYSPGNQQPVYPQQAPYVPYGAYQQPMAQQTQETPSEEYNPGTRVLYQSPDFEHKDGSTFTGNVGVSFADSVKTHSFGDSDDEANSNSDDLTDSNIEFEEVSIDTLKKPPIVKKSPAAAITTEELTDVDIYTDSKTGDISFAAFNAVNPSLEVEEFEEELPAYEEDKDNDNDTDEKKPLTKFEIIRRVILSVAIVAIIVSVGMLINEWRLSRENDNVMEEASDLILTDPTEDEDKDDDEDKTTTKPLTPEEQWAEIKKNYPNVLFPAGIQLKYAQLYGENQEFVGYLSADGVGLNLPVVQTTNDEVYLNKNFYGKTTKYGCPFVTHLNNMSYNHLDMNTVIFGHHMNNGTIFGALDKYKTVTGYKSAPVISFNTIYKDYQWKVVAAMITNGYAKDDNNYIFPYYFTNLSSQSKLSAYLSELAQRSLYDTGVDVLPSDKLLTLSTCSHEFEDARFVVVARLVREGESIAVDTSRVVVNSKPRYPQAYYSKKGMTNPYKNASRWVAD